ncbi:MAG: penicillin-binding transpeptidase domain-containing protein, partial [Xanthobacteraceae bacterium]
EVKQLADIAPWRLAVVLETGDQAARIGLYPAREPGGALTKEREVGIVGLDGVKWAKATEGPTRGRTPGKVNQVLNAGDVVYVEPLNKESKSWRLRQAPDISGAIVVMDPQTGRVQAMVGGFSYDQSQFNRATQAMRQPGSSFKPFVYAAALDNGYTPATVVLDGPIEIDQGPGLPPWRPENYSTGKYYGPQTLRFGIEHSRNVMTVRLAQDVGMPLIAEYAKRFGVYDNLPAYLSFALGAGETTVLRMVAAYSMFDNGGKRIIPTFIDRIQDRYGRTIYKHDQRECRGCKAQKWEDQPEPTLVDRREQVIDPMTAYQITSMLEGVVQRGTATVVRQVGKPVAGKTGTTNDEKDVWIIGYSPDLAVGVFMGYDKPKHIGRGATGGHMAAPVVTEFLKVALADKPAVPFRVPAGIKLIRVDARTGMRVGPGTDGRVILEAFKPGTAPPDNYSVIGYTNDQPPGPFGATPDAERAVRRGSGLY